MKQFFRRVFRAPSFYCGVGVFGLIAHLYFSLPIYSNLQKILGWLLLVIFLFVAATFVRKARRTPPVLLFVALQFYLMYGFSVFVQSELQLLGWIPYIPQPDSITTALVMAILADLVIVLGYLAGGKVTRSGGLRLRLFYPEPAARWELAVTLFGIVGAAEFFVANLRSDLLPLPLRQPAYMILNPYLALALVVYFEITSGSSRMRNLRMFMIAWMMFVGFLSGMLEPVLAPLYLWIIGTWIWKKELRAGFVVAAIVGFVILSPVKHHYRRYAYAASAVGSVADVGERLNQWSYAFKKTFDDPFAREKTVDAAGGRASFLLALAQAVEWVPEIVPHKKGEGTTATLLYFIPRVIWPSKPQISDLVNNRYALEFQFTTLEGLETATIGIFQPIDGYWDFGIAGVIGYSLLFGFIIGTLFSAASFASPVEQILAVVFSTQFLQTLASFQNMVASLFTLFIGCWIALNALRLVSGGKRIERRQHTPAFQWR